MAKLMPRKSPRKEEYPVPQERHSIASEFVKEMGLDDSFQSIHKLEEEDYSTGSSFWKSAMEKYSIEEKPSKPNSPSKVFVPAETRQGLPKSKSTASVATLLKKLKNDSSVVVESMGTSFETIAGTEHPQHSDTQLPIVDQLKVRISKIGLFVDREIKEMEALVGKGKVATEHEPVYDALISFKEQVSEKLDVLIRENAQISKDYKLFEMNMLERQSSTEERLKEWVKELHQEATKKSFDSEPISQGLYVTKLMEELKCNISANHGLDRPTKNIIMGLNDKLIQLAKLQEHSFESIGFRIGHLEKKHVHSSDSELKSLLNSIELRLDRIEKRGKDNDLDLQRILDTLSRRSSDSDSDDDFTEGRTNVRDEMKNIKTLIESESQVTQDRMNQFMNMFTILQDALFTNINGGNTNDLKELNGIRKIVQDQQERLVKMEKIIHSLANENKMVLTLATKINTTLVKYLPLNLETKLHKIEALLSE
jgi:hypothetical protein